MKNFDLGEILTRAGQIVWKHKILWVFGILASCSSGNGGGSGNSGSNFSSDGQSGGLDNLPFSQEQARQFEQFFSGIEQNIVPVMIGLFCFIIFLSFIFYALGTMGRIGIIHGAASVEGGAEALTFGGVWTGSTPYFWRVFGMGILVGLPAFLLVMSVLAIAFFGLIVSGVNLEAADTGAGWAAFGGVILLMLGCFCILALFAIPVGLIARQAENAIVLEDLGIFDALRRGWEVFKTNLGPILLMGFILWIIQAFLGFIMAIPALVIVAPAAIGFAMGGASDFTPLIIGLICLVLFWPVALIGQGFMLSFVESAWTLTFIRLVGYQPRLQNEPPQNNDSEPIYA